MFSQSLHARSHQKEHKTVFKITTILYQMLFLLCGIDFGFFRLKNIPLKVVKIYSVIFVLVLSATSWIIFKEYFSDNIQYLIWTSILLIKYNVYALLFLFLEEDKSLNNFHNELSLADEKCRIFTEEKFGTSILLSLLILIFVKIFYLVIECIFSYVCSIYYLNLMFLIMDISTAICIISFGLTFNLINLRLRALARVLESVDTSFIKYQHTYKIYVDIIEKYKKAFNPMMILGLLITIPETMGLIYFNLESWRYNRLELSKLEFILENGFVFCTLSVILLPAVQAGNVAAQAETIQTVLSNKLAETRDDREACQLKRFLRYVSARNCRFRVALLPLDAGLVTTLISFCVTYLIVIVQFTKLY